MKDYTYFQPTCIPRASLLIVHGMAEHQGRYAKFAKFLADNGIAVMTFDHLGHGQLAKKHNTLGFMGNPEPAERMLSHVMAHADRLAESYPDIPMYILGHSMGSFVVRSLIARFGDLFAGAIIMGTSAPNPLAAAFVPVTKAFNRLAPKHSNPVFDNILGKVNNLPFRHEPDLQGFNWLNSNPARVQDYLADPLCGFTFTNNGFFGLMTLMNEGTNKSWSKSIPKTLPMLLVSGKDDPVGQMGKGLPMIAKGLAAQGFKHVTVKQYAGMRHEILLEDHHQQVFDDILDWISQWL